MFNQDECLFLVKRRLAFGDGDDDEDEAERNWGFSYGKFTRERFEDFRPFLPLTGGVPRKSNEF